MKLASRRGIKSLEQNLKRNWLTIFLIFVIFLGIVHRILTNFKFTNKNFHLARGIYLKNFKDDEKFLNSTPNSNIFFIEADPGDEKILEDGRQACSVESTAFLNPDMKVYVNFLTVTDKLFMHDSKLLQALQSYENIKIRFINFENYFKGSMLEEWFRNDPLWAYDVRQVSQVAKMLMLLKHGGVSMDFNIISLFPFKNITEENFACAIERSTLLSSLIRLKNDENGQKFADGMILKVLKAFEVIPASDEQEKFELGIHQNYFNEDQGAPSPSKLFDKLIKNACGGAKYKKNQTTNCDGFNVLPNTRCAPASFRNYQKFFQVRNSRFVFDKLKSAYFVHMWFDQKKTGKMKIKTRTAFSYIVNKFCPKVAAVLKEI